MKTEKPVGIYPLKVLLKDASILSGRNLAIETWAPADGWTRYRVEEGGTHVSHYMTKGEMEGWLRAFIEGCESVLGRDRVREIYREKGNPYDPSR